MKAAGVPHSAMAFSCIGRWLPEKSEAFSDSPGPCNYAGGGLFRLNPVTIVNADGTESQVFDFAERPLVMKLEEAAVSNE